MNNKGCLSIDDLYNFCCLKTQIYRSNVENNCRIFKNNILEYINGCYETKMVDNAVNGYNYSVLYEGEIPYIIIKELQEELSNYFYNFKIKIHKIHPSFFDKILNKHDIYQIIVVWKKDDYNSTDIDTISNDIDNISNNINKYNISTQTDAILNNNDDIKLLIDDNSNNDIDDNIDDNIDDDDDEIIHINSEDFEHIL